MPSQLTVRLADELDRALTQAAAQSQRKRSEIVRLALQQYLGFQRPGTRPADRVRHLFGCIESGVPDLAENHRTHILKSLADGD